MKRKITKLKAWLASGLLLVSIVADAQTNSYPFPQNTTYTYGRKPSSPASADAQASYDYWKTNFVTSSGACGYRRVIWDYYNGGRGKTDKSSSVSEGIGYGMLLAAYAGDASLFSDLWNFYKVNRNGNGVMNWHVENCGAVGQNGATDAELDVAMALVVASYQWQSNAYLNDAKSMISIIRTKEFDGSIQKPGDQFGGSNLVNPSYFAPGYYRVFATIEPAYASFWTAAAAKGYEIIFKADKKSNGLVPDWCDANGNASSSATAYEDQGKNFIYDAVRTPLRSAIDYLWFGNADAAKYCTRITDWSYNANGGTTNSLGSKYSPTGSKLDASHSNTFVGCFTVAAMAAEQAQGTHTSAQYLSYLNAGYTDNKNTSPGYGQYFNATLKALSQFILSGNFYLPPPDNCTAPDLGAAKSLCKSNPVVLNSNIPSATSYVWKKNDVVISGATSSTYDAKTEGTYEVVVKQGACVRRSSVEVASATIAADFSYSVQATNVAFTNTSSGASNYAWSYKLGAGASTPFATTRDANNSFLTAGSYDITLTVTNAAFGCAGTSTMTKKVVVGGGAGWVADDFNDHQNGDAWVGSTPYINELPMTYCSADDAKTPGATKDCPNNPCSLFEAVCKGTKDATYTPFGITFNDKGTKVNMDLTAVPYFSIKLRSTVAVNLGFGVNAAVVGKVGDRTTNRQFVTIPANKDTIINLDFSSPSSKLCWYDALNSSVATDFTKVHGIEFYAFEKLPTFTGTISIDWVIAGGKSLPAPQFNLKRDVNGYLVYEDPDGDTFYNTVPDWKKKVRSCSSTATLKANACSASTIKWFSGASQVGTGDTYIAAPGIYTVQLINNGGVTTDTVEVTAAGTTADFVVDRTNYDVHLNNNSTGYHTFTWAYGDLANDLPGSTKWDIGYHNYKKKGAGTYTIVLTITDTLCNVTKTHSKDVVISCDSLVSKPVFVTVDTVGCAGDKVTIKISPVANHSGVYGWFGPTGTTFTKTVGDTLLSRDVTFGSVSGPLTVQAYNDCGIAARTANLTISTVATSEFTSGGSFLDATFSATHKGAGDIYAWTFGDVAAGTSTKASPVYTYADGGTYDVCLTVSNACGVAPKVCKTLGYFGVGINEVAKNGGLNIYPSISSTEINVSLSGTSTIQIVNMIGAVVSTRTMTDKAVFDVSVLPAGVYFFNIQQGSESLVKKFIVQ
ncbi:MAG: glycosyl hydrolase family 8 [Bacteroidetes bacterium]|nr:glycosyl hydrolase family 8 [Bacteroidota bacterium]